MVPVEAGKLARVTVRGVVQGVGFRPFVYRLAREHKLRGWVRNTSGSVEIEAEGESAGLERFLQDLKGKAPPAARVEAIEFIYESPRGYLDFTIEPSQAQAGRYQPVSPDIATCPDCLSEILSPADRRYRYPFTNCTNCGPRFTIIEDIPYDRPNTTMRSFSMCPECQREYDDPLDRRFHAQPNACPVCGPRLELVDGRGQVVSAGDVIKAASDTLKEGKVLALRGLGGFQLACDATNESAVSLLRQRKHRPGKPFAVMLATIEGIERHCAVSLEEKRLLESPQCPIVLLDWKRGQSNICEAVAPNLKHLGIMLPYTPLHHLLLRETGLPLVMTSGNLSEEPIAKDNDEALRRLASIADYFLLHNRDIYARYDDSVFIVEEDTPRAVRRARGYAPFPIILPFKSRQVLACGAEEKSTFCLTRDEYAFVSQHIGDMENEDTLEHFENTVELYRRLFRVEPEIIACDMHPDYLSTRYAVDTGARLGLKVVPVQHHHAHIASCLAENGVVGPVIGVTFDGTGYGPDGTIWGGEFLVADQREFRRVGHLDCVPLPGGAVAIRKPYRMALSYLFTLLGEDVALDGLGLRAVSPPEVAIVRQQLTQKVNAPLTSSAGRLFDAVAALTGVRGEVDYEAQAAIELEMVASDEADRAAPYPFGIVEAGGTRVVQLGGLLAAVVADVRGGASAGRVSARFHATVAGMIVEMCRLVSRDTGLKQVALSGGVFQNRRLFRLGMAGLRGAGFEVLTHRLVPCNDGGISLGQAVVASLVRESS